MAVEIRGAMPPVPTNFDAGGALDLDGFASNFARWNTTGLSGYVVLGSNGEFVSLSESEKLAVLERARSVIPRNKLMIAGTGVESTRLTIELTRRAAGLGADAAIVITPSYFRPGYSNDTYIKHYLAVADASPIPILGYNMPSYAGVDLPSSVWIAISKHPNIVGYKESGPNIVKISEVAANAEPHFSVIAGSTSYLYPSVVVGAKAAVMGLANLAPESCVALFNAAVSGDSKLARERHERLLEANAAVTTRFGVAGMKAGMDLCGYHGGLPRLPVAPLSDSDRRILADILLRTGLPVTQDAMA